MIILATSSENGDCYNSTANLDGERALKPKQVFSKLQKMFQSMSLE